MHNGGEIRQALVISGERHLMGRTAVPGERAFDISGEVFLSREEARSGEWILVEI